MPTAIYDAIIVGSGITGGWAAKELTEKGLNTLVLEAGRTIVPERDYVEHVPVWELRHRDWDDRFVRERTQPIQRECYYACDEYSHQFFVNDQENPYSFDPGKHFSWIRGRQVGGKSITWGRQSYRWSDLDFEANLKDGIAVDWPIRYADIAPWYDYVEEFAGVSGQPEGLRQLPDGKFLPPMELTCVELDLKDALAKHFDDRMLTIGRSAVLTRVHKGRTSDGQHAVVEMFGEGVLEIQLDAGQLHGRKEFPVGELPQAFRLPADAGKLFDIVVPRSDVRVADWPVDGDPVFQVGFEIEIAPAVALPSPGDGLAADLAAANPGKMFSRIEGVGIFLVVYEKLVRVFVAGIIALALNRLGALANETIVPVAVKSQVFEYRKEIALHLPVAAFGFPGGRRLLLQGAGVGGRFVHSA